MDLEQRRRVNNWFYTEYLDKHAVDENGKRLFQSEAAKRIGISHGLISGISAGKNGVSPETLLATLQSFPPENMEEFREIGQKWAPFRSIRERKDKFPRRIKFYTNYLLEKNPYIIPTRIAQILGISEGLISRVLSGKTSISERVVNLTLERFPPIHEQEREELLQEFQRYRTLQGLKPGRRDRI